MAHACRPQGIWRRAALAACCGLLVGAGGSIELVHPLELFRGEVERFASDVTLSETEPDTLNVYGRVETRDAATLEASCVEIAAAARDLLRVQTLNVFLRSDPRTLHECEPVRFDESESEHAPLLVPLPRQPRVGRPDGLCIGDCMLHWGMPRVWPPHPSPDSTRPDLLIRIEPRYPARALQQRIEGWVLVQFSISELGTVVDPFVVDAEPPGVFDRAALRAVSRWKYRPALEDGAPAERRGVQEVLTFELER